MERNIEGMEKERNQQLRIHTKRRRAKRKKREGELWTGRKRMEEPDMEKEKERGQS
jgi:hypothetical protein